MARHLPSRRGKEEPATHADARVDQHPGDRRIEQGDEENGERSARARASSTHIASAAIRPSHVATRQTPATTPHATIQTSATPARRASSETSSRKFDTVARAARQRVGQLLQHPCRRRRGRTAEPSVRARERPRPPTRSSPGVAPGGRCDWPGVVHVVSLPSSRARCGSTGIRRAPRSRPTSAGGRRRSCTYRRPACSCEALRLVAALGQPFGLLSGSVGGLVDRLVRHGRDLFDLGLDLARRIVRGVGDRSRPRNERWTPPC